MFKKSIYLLAAFLLGLLINITIQACGGDSDVLNTENTNSGQNYMPDPDERYKWDIEKVAYEEWLNDDGTLFEKCERTFDKQGRIIQEVLTTYYNDEYLSTSIRTTLYTYSKNMRTITCNYKFYNPDGSINSERNDRTRVQTLWK